MAIHMRIKTGDLVSVRVGKDRGKTGKVLQVFSAERRIVVEGANEHTKHARTRGRAGEKGQKITFWGPLPVANVSLVCPKCSKPTRVGAKVMEDGKKSRVCKKCSATL